MREIKFRVWRNNRMSYPNQKDAEIWDSNMILPYCDSGLSNGVMVKKENNILMQFIGRKDKNGKEIYEGDIIETNNFCGKTWFLIKYEEDSCGTFSAFHAVHIKSFDKKNGSQSSIHCGVTDSCEVIGNIYENPELLKTEGGKK